MRAKSMALLMLALGCGLVAAIGITQVLAERNNKPPTPTGETAQIFVATKDISLGEPVSAAVLKQEPWPKDKIPRGALTSMEDIEGRRARQKLFAGEPILENKLLGKGSAMQGASAVIPKGYRVVSVQVDSVSGSTLILPGDRVDVLVYLVGNTQREIPETSTRTVLQDIKVFAVNDVIELDKEKDGKERTNSKTISLLVTPAQAAKVTLASEMGKIRLVMRSPEDNAHVDDATSKPEELLGRSAYSDRKKEAESEKKASEEKKGLLELISQMKANVPVKQTPEAPSMITWTMRILQPDGINDVIMESENTPAAENSPLRQWRVMSSEIMTAGSGGPGVGKAAHAKKPATSHTPAPVVPEPAETPPAAAGDEPPATPDEPAQANPDATSLLNTMQE